jgi:hypothetical protein
MEMALFDKSAVQTTPVSPVTPIRRLQTMVLDPTGVVAAIVYRFITADSVLLLGCKGQNTPLNYHVSFYG